MNTIHIYTDGACSGNQNKDNLGGWGAILEYGPHRKELYGGEANTTNNRMELTALLMALRALRKPDQTIRVFSDSAYLTNCFREQWYQSWQRNGWKTSNKTEVENRDLWESIFEQIRLHSISFYRVKGHVRLDSRKTDLEALYQKFLEWNGTEFTMDDFRYVTQQNVRADALANQWIQEERDRQVL